MKSVKDSLRLFATYEHTCPYLPEKNSVNAVVDPNIAMTVPVYSRLIDDGFRRSGIQVYRPYCPDCNACISTRIPVDLFKMSRSQKRVWNKNQDLIVQENHQGFKPAYTELYARYLYERHPDGDIAADEVENFSDFVETTWCDTFYYEFFDQDKQLLCIAAVDALSSGLSAVYTFFDPFAAKQRSLGTYALLWEIEQAKKRHLSYVYPGYWIEKSKKMNYKTQFQPIEGRTGGKWVRLEKQRKSA